MATNPSTIESIKALVASKGLARTNRYEVDFSGLASIGVASGGALRDLALTVREVSLGGKQIQSTPFSLWRNPVEMPTGYNIDETAITFICPNDYFNRKIFLDWQNKIVNPDTYLVAYTNEYKCDITINQLDLADNIVYSTTLVNTFPKTVTAVSYSNDEADIVTFEVTFTSDNLQ